MTRPADPRGASRRGATDAADLGYTAANDAPAFIEALTAPEVNRKAQLEATIEHGMQTFVEVGLALMEIRDARLYRADYGTFEEYCRERLGWTRQHTNRMIASAEVTTNLEPIGSILPATESQARPLAALPPAQQREAWERVLSAREEHNP